jgi:hypothetical protein
MGIGDESSVGCWGRDVESRAFVPSFSHSLVVVLEALTRSDYYYWYSIFLRNNFFSQGPLVDGR